MLVTKQCYDCMWLPIIDLALSHWSQIEFLQSHYLEVKLLVILPISATSTDKVWCIKHFVAHVTTARSNSGFSETLHAVNTPFHRWSFSSFQLQLTEQVI